MRSWQYTTRWLLGSQLAARVLGLLNSMLLARLLAPAAYGSFTQAMAHASVLAPLADGGIAAVICRHVARRRGSARLLAAAGALRILQSLALWAIAVGSGWVLYSTASLRIAMLLAGAYWAVACLQQLLAGIARARLQASLEARAVLIERAATVILAAAGAYLLGLWGALAGVLVGGLLALGYTLRCLPIPRARVHRRAWRLLLWVGTPLAVADVCHAIIMRLDIFFIWRYHDAQQVGWYGSASTLVWASNLITGTMALALVPASALLGKEAAAVDARVLKWMLAIAFGLAVLFSAGAHLWVPLLYGNAYLPAVQVLRILAWCLVPAAVVAWSNAVLLVRHRTTWVGGTAAWGIICTSVLNTLWVPVYGGVGAAYAQLATQILMAAPIYAVASRIDQ